MNVVLTFPLLFVFLLLILFLNMLSSSDTRSKVSALQHPSSPCFLDINVTFAPPFFVLPFVRAKSPLGTKPSTGKFTGGVSINGTKLVDGFAFQKMQFFPCFPDTGQSKSIRMESDVVLIRRSH